LSDAGKDVRTHGSAGGPAGADFWLLVARMLMVVIFLVSGLMKMADPPDFIGFAASHHVPWPAITMWPVAIAELVGALGVLLGFRTRFCCVMFTIYILVLGPIFHQFWTFDWGHATLMAHIMLDDFLHHLTMAGGFIVLAVAGPGALSIDAARAGSVR
jgi:putative oxidoreductase